MLYGPYAHDATAGDAMTEPEEFLSAQLRAQYAAFSAQRYPDARRWVEAQLDIVSPDQTFETVDDLTLFLVQQDTHHVSIRKCPNEVLLLRDVAHDVWRLAELLHRPFSLPRRIHV